MKFYNYDNWRNVQQETIRITHVWPMQESRSHADVLRWNHRFGGTLTRRDWLKIKLEPARGFYATRRATASTPVNCLTSVEMQLHRACLLAVVRKGTSRRSGSYRNSIFSPSPATRLCMNTYVHMYIALATIILNSRRQSIPPLENRRYLRTLRIAALINPYK